MNKKRKGRRGSIALDPVALCRALAEKERIKGHHSPEGRAIRTMARAVNGWDAGSLSRGDAAVLCRQAVEDWLKGRLRVPAWAQVRFPALVEWAVREKLLAGKEADWLKKIYAFQWRGGGPSASSCLSMFDFTIKLVEKRW